MNTRLASMSAFLAAAAAAGTFTTKAEASGYREAPAIADDPAADNTDLYAWIDASGNLVVVANYIGLELPEGGPNWAKFSDDVLYEVHVARGPSSLADAITYQFQFHTTPYARVPETTSMQPNQLQTVPAKGQEFFGQLSGGGAFNQTYTVTKIVNGQATALSPASGFKVPPPNVGPTTNEVAYGYTIASGDTYEKHWIDAPASGNGAIDTLANGEGRVFVGPRDDPFYADLGAIYDLAQLRIPLQYAGGKNLGGGTGAQPVCTNCTPRNSVQYQNVHSIVLEIPGTVANGGTAVAAAPNVAQVVGVWASASRRKVTVYRADGADDHYGAWRQISRQGLPFVNEMIIGLQDKDYWNRTTPAQDESVFAGYFDNPIAARDGLAVGYYESGGLLTMCNIENSGPPLTNRLADLVPVMNLGVVNAAYTAAGSGIQTVGDVLRLDLGSKNADFPNGRRIVAGTNAESVDVVDTYFKMLFCTLTHSYAGTFLDPQKLAINTPYGGVPDGVSANETNYRATFPYLASPWAAFNAAPHAAPLD